MIKATSSDLILMLHFFVLKAQFYLWQIGVNDERPELTDSKDPSESSNQRLSDTRRQEQRDQRCHDGRKSHLNDYNGKLMTEAKKVVVIRS